MVAKQAVVALVLFSRAAAATSPQPAGAGHFFDVRSFGAVADWNGTAGTDNRAAFNAAIAACGAAHGGVVHVPHGKYMVMMDPGTTAFAIQGKSDCTLSGDGPLTVIYGKFTRAGNFTHHQLIGGSGSYTDFPALGNPPQNYPPVRYAMKPAKIGDVSITASTARGFAKVRVGEWIEISEGPAPKWDYKVSRAKVAAIRGDTLMLDHPLDMTFNDESRLGIGIFRLTPVENFWVKSLTLTGNTEVYGFQWAQSVGGGVDDVTLNLPFTDDVTHANMIHPYANDTHQWTMRNCRILQGAFVGFNRADHGLVEHTRFESWGASTTEFGQGGNYNRWSKNEIRGAMTRIGNLAIIGGGATWFEEYTDNYFAAATKVPAFFVSKGAVGLRFSRNTLVGCSNNCIAIHVGSAYQLGQPAVANEIAENTIVYDTKFEGTGPAITIDEYPKVQRSQVRGNTLIAPASVKAFIKVGRDSDTALEKPTLTIINNTRRDAAAGIETPKRSSQ